MMSFHRFKIAESKVPLIGTILFLSQLFLFNYTAAARGIPEAVWSIGIGEPVSSPGVLEIEPSGNVAWHFTEESHMKGAPVGGFGSGSIGRSYDGAFRQWHLDIGRHLYQVIEADQFSVFQKSEVVEIVLLAANNHLHREMLDILPERQGCLYF